MEAVGEERVKGGRQEEGERFEGVAMAMEGEKREDMDVESKRRTEVQSFPKM